LQVLGPSPIILSREPRKATSWLQVLSHVDPRFGGIAQSVPQFCRTTRMESEYECPITAFCNVEELDHVSAKERAIVKCLPPSRFRWIYDLGLRQRLKETIRKAQGVHIHGLWETHCAVTAKAARACKRPYIVSAHGMLDRYALHRKRIKKALYAALIETGNLQRATCLRALTRDEADDYRRIGLTNPIAIVPTGVEAPRTTNPEMFWHSYPHLREKRIVLSLGRLHPKKGLHLLLQAWAHVASSAKDVHLVIAGPDSENTQASLERMIDELNISNSVSLTGMLTTPAKWSALAAANLFVSPSYSEGFSSAILEALVMGLPVIVSNRCHIPQVQEFNCGWVIEPDAAPLERALEEFFHLPAHAALKLGQHGRDLVEKQFTWSVVGRQMAEVYDWVRGGPKPAATEVC